MDKFIADITQVLIVDDQVLAQGYMKYSLEELGFQNITYIDKFTKAKERIMEQHFDLIVCSYNLNQEKDGFFLYDELKANRVLSPRTAFIFISADTSTELVHSIVDLQPDDFLAKPFTIKDLDRRLTRILKRKRSLKDIYYLIDQKAYESALDEIERFLTDAGNAEHFPMALKTKGELLTWLGKHQEAKEFYEAILDVQSFTWAKMGLISTLIQLQEFDEAEKQILRLAFKPESQLVAYDLLTQLNIKQKDFDTALESVMIATEVSPRNLRRHQTARELSRVTHDYQTQVDTAKQIVRVAKNSVHDKPENYLNVVRASIDLAMTTDEKEAQSITKEAEKYLRYYEASGEPEALEEQLMVIQARMLSLQNQKANATVLMQKLSQKDAQNDDTDTLLDKAKAFHEVGMFSESEDIMAMVQKRCETDESTDELVTQFVNAKKKQLAEIKQSPRELNNAAVDCFQKGDLKGSLNEFKKAFTVMPKNTSIALNLLQALVMKGKQSQVKPKEQQLMQDCVSAIENGKLSADQRDRYSKVRGVMTELLSA